MRKIAASLRRLDEESGMVSGNSFNITPFKEIIML
jgi:hypothetical protein